MLWEVEYIRPSRLQQILVAFLAGGILSCLAGCRASSPVRHTVDVPHDVPVALVSYQSVAEAVMPEAPSLSGPHPVEEYVAVALSQNPRIQARQRAVDAAAMRVLQAASLKDPMLEVMGYPFFPNVPQTASGRKTIDMSVSQEVPWFGKLGTQASAAEAEANMARAELAATELEVREQVKRAYYELYYVHKAIEVTERSRRAAVNISNLAEARVKTGASGQDLLRAELAVMNTDTELVRMRQELQSSQARLARLLHISPDTPVRALSELPEEQIPTDLQRLYETAIALRPELHAQLSAVQRDRISADLARLQYYPDFTVSFAWGEMTTNRALAPTADGIDDLGVGLAANVPIYRKRIDAGVREAEAKAAASARQYDAMRDETQAGVKDLFAQAASQAELLRLVRREIVPKAERALEVSLADYQGTKVDFLQMTDNWQQVLRYQVMEQRLEAQLRQTLASLERIVGGLLPLDSPAPDAAEPVPLPQPDVPLPQSAKPRSFPSNVQR